MEEEKKKTDKLEATGEFKLNSSSFKDIRSAKKENILDDTQKSGEESFPIESRMIIKNKAYNTQEVRVDIEKADISDQSETNVNGDQINNHVNSVKLSNSISSMRGRDQHMAMILKMGAGGDAQDHVSTPVRTREKPYEETFSKRSSFQQRAASASVHQPKAEVRPKSYASQAQTLKRIKSELETIQEKKEEINMDQQNQQMMENIMVDESYSFSLRQLEKQASKKELAIENSRMSNLSAYG